jgi:hypothetical protein
LICANPFAGLAVIHPTCPVVTSLRFTCIPCGVSCSLTVMWSPDFMKRSFLGFGVYVAAVASTGFAGAWEWPFLVM